jgi:hypothetical protein
LAESIRDFLWRRSRYEVLGDEDLRRQYDVRWKMENELPSTMAEHHATSCEWARMRYSEAQTVAVRARAAAREVSVCFASIELTHPLSWLGWEKRGVVCVRRKHISTIDHLPLDSLSSISCYGADPELRSVSGEPRVGGSQEEP